MFIYKQPIHLGGGDLSKSRTQKNPKWFYYALGAQTLITIILLGMLKDLMWIL